MIQPLQAFWGGKEQGQSDRRPENQAERREAKTKMDCLFLVQRFWEASMPLALFGIFCGIKILYFNLVFSLLAVFPLQVWKVWEFSLQF